MLEDMIVLLRGREVQELERKLHVLEASPDFAAIARALLLRVIERFRLEHLPEPFVARLSGVTT
jgi:hypothetical protein